MPHDRPSRNDGLVRIDWKCADKNCVKVRATKAD